MVAVDERGRATRPGVQCPVEDLIEAAPYLATPFEPERTFADSLALIGGGIESQLRHA